MPKFKNKSGLSKALKPISKSELLDWSTSALLGRLKKLRICMEMPEHASDYTQTEIDAVKHLIVFKSDPAWKQAYADVKCVLKDREHIKRHKRF
ncbi:MAG: hypothetical protein ACPGVT_12285 [Maricaulaceae bacterium]